MRGSIACLFALSIATTPAANSIAGEISGLPPHLVPTLRPDYQFFLGNDFLAPGTNDDFRTQQIIATARLKHRWVAVLDHSMFTNNDTVTDPPERIDTMTLSLGYEFFQRQTDSSSTVLTAGLGVRGVGNFEGSRIQNGFHRLIESGSSTLPYSTTRQTDLSAWGLAERLSVLKAATGHGLFNGWDLGYWARAGAFVTADGQLDAVAGIYAVAARTNYDVWVGARYDVRDGYDNDVVLNEAARQEQSPAIAWGLRLGSLVIETVHRLDSKSSYGQLSFVSAPETRKEILPHDGKADFQLGLHVPHMMFQLAGRLHTNWGVPKNSGMRQSFVVDIRAGQPQLGRDVTRFVDTQQVTLGLEWSGSITETYDWLRLYGNVAGGWRSERLLGRATLLGEEAPAVDGGVITVGAGIEIDAARLAEHWRHSLRFGVTAWRPSSDAIAIVGGEPSTIMEPDASIVVAWTIDYH